MLTHQIPITLQKAVNERIINIMNGKDPDTITGLQYPLDSLFYCLHD